MKIHSDHPALKKQKKVKASSIVLFAFLGLYTLIQVYPLIWLFLFSFKNNNEIYSGNAMGIPKVWRFSNYFTVLTSGNVAVYLLNSVIVTGATIIISTILLTTSAYAIVRMHWRWNHLFLTYILLGMMVPLHATLLPLFIVLKNMNLLNSYFSIILPYVAFALPMGIFILVGFLQNIPKELEESACLDGCGIYRIFYYISLPLVRPAIATVAIFTFLSSWNELMFANTFISADKIKTLTVGIMSLSGQQGTQWGPIGAGLVIATVPTLIIYLMFSNQIQKSVIAGAIKG
ncbi:Trehalose transport system permease protein SugB [Caprobacter fermentans]|uniref:Trehalose transport system permease protein SugB n=1 Tax=Caproicibacter fermentans TaxID=2576756 RepID=A0A6N8HVQ4_9FIRM|nr:carbohydrate ABC transporter permease [Caproicibacter fermentans]MVB09884.1 Trehalose transport system permease protein SugB [Caproicibacter fermentans]OCN00332.1 sugar ABC transporter permease [Clostridium sp. W14A]